MPNADKTFMHFINWQRHVSVEELNGQKVVVKRNKPTKGFHEFLILYAYSLISMLLLLPSAPPAFSEITRNEGYEMRRNLRKIGIPTPALLSISDTYLIEEYIEGGDMYRALASGGDVMLAYRAGSITGRAHQSGYSFVDNKAQNYLVRGENVIRTDLGFMKKTSSHYSKSMDIGSFLASIMDLTRYGELANSFHDGYKSEAGSKFSYRSIVIRNLLSTGFSSSSKTTLRNMLLDSRRLVSL
jgi:tRNA A-37 threonylcarbamoyl transferase component Bud32